MSTSPNLRCGLCNEYFVNAVTVAGCMHSFCEECLLKNLSVSGVCPAKGCKKSVDKNGYRRDSTLQMLVYKFVPQMFFETAEKTRGLADASKRKSERELAQLSSEICDPDELLSICLEFLPAPPVSKREEDTATSNPSTSSVSKMEPPAKKTKKTQEHREVQQSFRRFFRCAAKVPIRTVRRLLETKLFLTDQFSAHFISDRDFQDIPDDVTLRTLVLDGGFDRTRPFRLFFTLIPMVNDDAPPVLDAETMPCLMPEAPVHQEQPSTVPPPGQLQPVQIVSPVVPALTVSLSTDIYGHSAPIITPQCAPRKRRKHSDPKKSPTEKSSAIPPSNHVAHVAHPQPIGPNMIVGSLIRPMFIAQPPAFLHHHRSPPNMPHMPLPYPNAPQELGSPPNKCAPQPRNEVDVPPQLLREDPLMSNIPPPSVELATMSPATSIANLQKVPSATQLHSSMPPRLEPSQQRPQPSHVAPPLPLNNCRDSQLAQALNCISHEVASTSKAQTSSPIERTSNPKLSDLHSMALESRMVPKLMNTNPMPQPLPFQPYYNGSMKRLNSPTRPGTMLNRPRSLERKHAQASSTQNGVNSAPKVKSTTSAPIQAPVEQQSRPMQTSLPQPPCSETQKMPVFQKALEMPLLPNGPSPLQRPSPAHLTLPSVLQPSQPPLSSQASSSSQTTPSQSLPSAQAPPHSQPSQPLQGFTSSQTLPLGPPQTQPPCSAKSETADNSNPVMVDKAVAPVVTTLTTAMPTPTIAPMDFRRMATLNKQSLGRTLQAVLTSGRTTNADVTKPVVSAPSTGCGGSAGDTVDVRPAPVNGRIQKETAVDLRFPNPQSLSI